MEEPHDKLSDQRVIATCLVILTVIAVGAALAPLRPVLVPLLLALLFTYCLRPVVEMQIRHAGRMPRPASPSAPRGCSVCAILALFGLLVVTFVADLNATCRLSGPIQGTDAPGHQERSPWNASARPRRRTGFPIRRRARSSGGS